MSTIDHFQFDLFCSEILPSWLPDETVYSLSARFARLGGHNTSKMTGKLLFGHPRRGYQHDFAAGLTHLSTLARGTLGSATDIVNCHSIAPYYLAFASTKSRQDVYRRMSGSNVGSLKFTMGLLTSGFRANHPLKGCDQCELADRERHGVAYWRVAHQLPSALICVAHHQPLWAEHGKSDGAARFEWLLPDDIRPEKRVHLASRKSEASFRQHMRLSIAGAQLHRFGRSNAFSEERIQQTIRDRLCEFEFITPKGSIRRQAASEAYLMINESLGQIPTLRGLPTNPASAACLLSRVLRRDRGFAHATKHLAIITWLWPSWESFEASYKSRGTSLPTNVAREPLSLPDKDLVAALLTKLRSGISLSAAAVDLRVSIARAQRITATSEFSIERRPKKLVASRQDELRELARAGHSKHEIAESIGVSPQTVMRFINTDSQLKECWVSVRFATLRKHNRRSWLETLVHTNVVGTKVARVRVPAVYAWLYRNDNDWLGRVSTKIERRRIQRDSVVNWNKRDSQLATEISRSFGLGSLRDAEYVSASIGELCETVPELKAKLRKLDRLPKTAQLIDRLVDR